MAKKKLVLVALGGNVLTKKHDTGKIDEQWQNAIAICGTLMPLIERDYNLVITHGNGPQVGNILIQNELSKDVVPPMPIDVLVAKSEGHMGYLFQQALLNHLRRRNVKRYVVTMITQIMVDGKDKNFAKPTKPIGPFYTKEQAKDLRTGKKWSMIEDANKGWRRVVPSPKPVKIVQRHMISNLAEIGNIVIALGGGGIPIIKDRKGEYIGIEAVVDKDRASANLASEINVDLFIILTDENKVALNFGKLNEKRLNVLTVDYAERYLKEGHFLAGSMYPKIESSIDFLKKVDGQVLITSPEKLEDALEGKDGTRIVR